MCRPDDYIHRDWPEPEEVAIPVMRQHPSRGEPPYETLALERRCPLCDSRESLRKPEHCVNADCPLWEGPTA